MPGLRSIVTMMALGSAVQGLKLSHCPNSPQKRYELLRDFTRYVKRFHADLRWSLSGGSLLGAMRQVPPGFMKWDDDLDIDVPARDLWSFHSHLQHDCSFKNGTHFASSPKNVTRCGVMKPRATDECCGFGWRIEHRDSQCAYLDIMVLSLAGAPLPEPADDPKAPRKYWTIPWDKHDSPVHDAMMLQESQWQKPEQEDWEWRGPALTLFREYYFEQHELYPLQQMEMYGLTVNIPRLPWRVLDRFYGTEARHFGGGHDLRAEPQFLQPAFITID